ncbi:MAG: hypothetical protein KC643_30695 [Nitrospira sp.]|nr:hypothetical protein [Nitrospira sp.]MDR4486003.1 hypothetical protein [Nitrospirales bacterium]
MGLLVPNYIIDANVATNLIHYYWDEWSVKDYFIEVEEDQFERLDDLSDAANLALAIGCGEWISYRLSLLNNDPVPQNYLEAAWAAIVYPGYCKYIETVDDEWRGPIRGPLNMTISILNDGIHCRDTDSQEATRSCWMYNLAQHVLPHTDEFDRWFEACVLRLELYHPWVEDDDIWEEGPPFGLPVPREVLDPSFSYDPENAPELIDRFLRSLNPEHNPFLPSNDEDLEVPGFKGILYQYSPSDWQITD